MQLSVLDTPKTNYSNGEPLKETKSEKSALRVKSPKEYIVKLVKRSDIKEFMEKWHYSHNINGLMCDYCFGLYYNDTLIGAMIYGRMAMANQYKKYGDSLDEVVELRRLACIDDTVRNTESYFIGKTLKWLKKNTDIKVIVSYSDLFYNHTGIIYKASNFKLIGQTSKGKVIDYNGKLYHDHAIRSKYKGKLKPYAIRLRQALEDGEAKYVITQPKNIYEYKLK